MHIGVFDSGKGGAYVADNLKHILPEHTYVVVNDSRNVPYGARSREEIIDLTDCAIQPLLATCPIIVIACNTATMAGIHVLRERYPATMFVGIEPMIKPARSLTSSQRVTVLATPLTLKSPRYEQLKSLHGKDIVIDEPNTQDWARKIEDGDHDEIDITSLTMSVLEGSDVLILACTHYIALKQQFEQLYDVTVIEPSDAIAQQITRLINSR